MNDPTKGFDELSQELTDIAKNVSEPVRKEALDKGGEIIQKRARALVPVLQDEHYGRIRGYLKNSGIVTGENNGASIEIGWTKDGFYGRFLEYGTSKMAPRSHLRPAYEQTKNEVMNTMLQTMKLK